MTMPTRIARLFIFLAAGAVVATASIAAHPSNPDSVAQLLKTGSCPGCDLRNEQLVNLKLAVADLRGADLSGAFLYKSDLSGALLKGAKFTGANLGGANLTHAIEADLSGATTNENTICPDGKAGPCK